MDFDKTKFYLGKLCKRNHDYKETGYSLRWRSNSQCCLCQKEWRRNRDAKILKAKKPLIKEAEIKLNIDSSKYKLGKLCKRNHNYEGTGYSLRSISNKDCIECNRERYRVLYLKKTEHFLEYQKQYRRDNREKIKKYKDKYMEDEENRSKVKKYQDKYRKEHAKERAECNRQWRLRNKKLIKKKNKRYREENEESIKKYKHRYFQSNREKLAEQQKKTIERKRRDQIIAEIIQLTSKLEDLND